MGICYSISRYLDMLEQHTVPLIAELFCLLTAITHGFYQLQTLSMIPANTPYNMRPQCSFNTA
jgi:hypothetical protein